MNGALEDVPARETCRELRLDRGYLSAAFSPRGACRRWNCPGVSPTLRLKMRRKSRSSLNPTSAPTHSVDGWWSEKGPVHGRCASDGCGPWSLVEGGPKGASKVVGIARDRIGYPKRRRSAVDPRTSNRLRETVRETDYQWNLLGTATSLRREAPQITESASFRGSPAPARPSACALTSNRVLPDRVEGH